MAPKKQREEAMKAKFSPLERAYLNAVFHYHRDNSSSDNDSAVSKAVFALIKANDYTMAAIKAGEAAVTYHLFCDAVDAAEI